MAAEKKPNIDPQMEQILTRLKRTTQRIEEEQQEKERCVRCAEEIMRKVSLLRGGRLSQFDQ